MPERRTEERAGSPDRRDIPRPSLRLNLVLLAAAVAGSFFVRDQRQAIDAGFTRMFDRSLAGPSELNQITAELAEMNLKDGALVRELESRLAGLARLESLEAQDFYLSVDAAKRVLFMKSGNETVRETKVELSGAPKGAYVVAGVIRNGRDKILIRLNGLQAASFMISEADFKTMREQITPETRVYIF